MTNTVLEYLFYNKILIIILSVDVTVPIEGSNHSFLKNYIILQPNLFKIFIDNGFYNFVCQGILIFKLFITRSLPPTLMYLERMSFFNITYQIPNVWRVRFSLFTRRRRLSSPPPRRSPKIRF